jgi:hypothetical protein
MPFPLYLKNSSEERVLFCFSKSSDREAGKDLCFFSENKGAQQDGGTLFYGGHEQTDNVSFTYRALGFWEH